MPLHLDDLSWPVVPAQALLIVPLGSTEQHGPHLPFTVDADVATAVASGVGSLLGAVVAPSLAYGSSGEHAGFPGTLSIGRAALRHVLVELARSADWASRVAFINGHGGNIEPLCAAAAQLRREGRDVGWAPCAIDVMDLHAGRGETSLMLALRPETVRPDRPVGATGSMEEMLPRLRADGVRAVSANGVLGDATHASAREGEEILDHMIARATQRIRSWSPDANGLLTTEDSPAPFNPG